LCTFAFQQDLYSKVKIELLNTLTPSSRERHASKLLMFEEKGDRKPSQFLKHLWNLASYVPDYLLRISWTSWLPLNVQTALD
jgi:hypothetical protein